MIKNFCDFVNESHSLTQINRAIDVIIYECLKRFDLQGGNNSNDDDWSKIDPIFSKGQGPDLFVNIDWRDDGPEFLEEAEIVAKSKVRIDDKFKKYGIEIESFNPDETIVHIAELEQDDLYAEVFISDDVDRKVIDFYKKRESRIKELAEKLKIHLTSKKFGIS